MKRSALFIILVVLVLALAGNIVLYNSSESYLGLQPGSNQVIQPGTFCYPSEPEGELSCGDGQDNDCDGNIDCSDSECTETGFCVAPRLDSVIPGDVHPSQYTPIYLSGNKFNSNSRVSVGNVYFPKSGTHFISSQMLLVEGVPGAPPGDYEVFVSNNLNDGSKKSANKVVTFVEPADYIIDSCEICDDLTGLGCNRNSCETAQSVTCKFGTNNYETLGGSCEVCSVDTMCSDYGDDALSCVRNKCGIYGGCVFSNGQCDSVGLTTQTGCANEPMPSCIPYGVCSNTRPSCVNGNWVCNFALNNPDLETFTEVSCSDGLDNDCDNKVDCDDNDCFGNSACDNAPTPPEPNPGNGGSSNDPECDDGIDNDNDGRCDLSSSTCEDGSIPGDSDCSNYLDDSEDDGGSSVNPNYVPTVNACADGLDNDSDGLIDLNDPGCDNANDNSELDVVPTGGSGNNTQTLDPEESNLKDIIFWVITSVLGLGILIVLVLIIMQYKNREINKYPVPTISSKARINVKK
jgi:hypothetical protein